MYYKKVALSFWEDAEGEGEIYLLPLQKHVRQCISGGERGDGFSCISFY